MAMSNAERQRRYRDRRKGAIEPPPRARPAREPSRTQRWRTAVATLLELQEDYRERLHTLPETLHDSAYGLRLQAIDDLDLGDLETIEPPLGYGRD